MGSEMCIRDRLPTGQCNIQVTTQVMHGTQTSPYKRKNSPFTRTMENACGSMARSGYTPKECKESLQSLVLHGGHATKDPAGGVLGSLDDRCMWTTHVFTPYAYSLCVCTGTSTYTPDLHIQRVCTPCLHVPHSDVRHLHVPHIHMCMPHGCIRTGVHDYNSIEHACMTPHKCNMNLAMNVQHLTFAHH